MRTKDPLPNVDHARPTHIVCRVPARGSAPSTTHATSASHAPIDHATGATDAARERVSAIAGPRHAVRSRGLAR